MRTVRSSRNVRPGSRPARSRIVGGGGGGGSSITYIGSNEGVWTTAPSLALPAGAASGDFMVVAAYDRAAGSTGVPTAGGTINLIGAGPGDFFGAWWMISDGNPITFNITSSGPVVAAVHVYRGPTDATGLTTSIGQFGSTSGFTGTAESSLTFPAVAAAAGGYNGWMATQTDDYTSGPTWSTTPDDSGGVSTIAGNDAAAYHAVLAGGVGSVAQTVSGGGIYQEFFSEGMAYTLT